MGPPEGDRAGAIDALDEQAALATITRVERRVQAASDRWYAGESLIVGASSAAMALGQHEWPRWGWRWSAAYFLCGFVALTVHLWRRRVHRAPSRSVQVVWPATLALTVASGLLMSAMPAGVSGPAIASAVLPTLPGLVATVWIGLR